MGSITLECAQESLFIRCLSCKVDIFPPKVSLEDSFGQVVIIFVYLCLMIVRDER